ncbi:riboflavin biosynthesis protein RibD protein [Leifsonia aquatica ATCC 14665]|uniref:Riboflavin biosynthesis protein RibD protein n=1 Tax=Leifsonia aquatica ATCC 14665 TaxID=1358026 RepID=U2RAS5_LEIAQ|nr:dihydrofolate reductase family protein [Leifsonia aquatica]ERK72345.1 riboflavin biosynthesis protein RibD protein [Leifsonia aquatica ATCC 14665]
MTVRVDLNISLDGVVVPEDPMGAEWGRLVEHYTATRTFHERVFHDTSGAGTTGVDDRYAAAYFEGIGAEIMGAGMFGLHTSPDDPDWRGWWGDEPPFQAPVLVLTHRERPPIEFANGTRFEFLATTPEAALERATALAGDADVRIGGGADVVRTFLAAGLVDRIHVAVSPIILGEGTRLWDGLSDLDLGYTATSEVAESGVIHVTFTR